MAFLRTTLCAVFMVTVALSKPVCLSECEDSSKSSDSSESNSSEEAATQVGPSQEPLADMSNGMEETDPTDTAALLPSADTGPSPATLDTSALPDHDDPQTSSDALQLMPDDPSQTALGIDISQDMPHSDPAHDSVTADTMHVLPNTDVSLHPELTVTDITIGIGGTNQPQGTTATYQGFLQDATPTLPPHITKATAPPFSTAPPLPIAIDTTLTGVPVCFTFQFTTPVPDPPRGDSM
ncbi:dentin sialophosphoprotein-like [Micropterus salmoides]|uniref:dentin sialophosphoprotein-like n=1 Tax=Micropterus salmoides TaxID=27706 RepID=UPI0018EC7DEE|nr:dentin sialophosphoprotein-like [Micropterus salmoides]